MADTYAVIQDGIVVNIIAWDGNPPLTIEGSLVQIIDKGGIGWRYDGSEFIRPPDPEKNHEQLVEEAALLKANLLSAAEQSISILQTKLLMGRKITESERDKVNSVLDYIDILTGIDPNLAPNITWPSAPN